jgi:hypothetical protein
MTRRDGFTKVAHGQLSGRGASHSPHPFPNPSARGGVGHV